MSSRLFQEVRETRGLCYSVDACHWAFQDSGNFGVAASTGEEEVADHLPVVLDELRKSLRDHRKARIAYRRSGSDEVTTRVVRLYAIVPASGMWYAVAYCESSEGLRVFRMDRVEKAEALADHYEIPADFSVSETLQAGKGLKAELPPTGIKVRYSARIARWIAEREGVAPDSDGSLTIEHPLADTDWGVRHVLQYGPDAEVLEPPALRDEIVRRLSVMSTRA